MAGPALAGRLARPAVDIRLPAHRNHVPFDKKAIKLLYIEHYHEIMQNRRSAM
jgi:hypothetical protein